jgi:hypothetical protein
MTKSKDNLPRRQVLQLAAAFVAIPAALPASASAVPTHKIPALIAAYEQARVGHRLLEATIDDLESSVMDDSAIRLHFYNCEAELSHFSDAERQKIRRGDEWSINSGHGELVRLLNATLEDLEQAEIALLEHSPESLQDLADLLQWHASKWKFLEGATRIEQADAASPWILAKAAQRLAGRV